MSKLVYKLSKDKTHIDILVNIPAGAFTTGGLRPIAEVKFVGTASEFVPDIDGDYEQLLAQIQMDSFNKELLSRMEVANSIANTTVRDRNVRKNTGADFKAQWHNGKHYTSVARYQDIKIICFGINEYGERYVVYQKEQGVPCKRKVQENAKGEEYILIDSRRYRLLFFSLQPQHILDTIDAQLIKWLPKDYLVLPEIYAG